MTATLRLHPLDAVSGMRRYLILLAIPLVRGLTAIGDGWLVWLQGAWIDLAALTAMLALGILRWRQSRIFVTEGRMVYERGLFFHTRDVFFADQISVFRVSRPWYLRPLHAVIIYPETMTQELKAFFPVILHTGDLKIIERLFLQVRGERIQTIVRPRPSMVAAAAAASSDIVGGLTFAAAVLSNTARYASEAAADTFLTAVFHTIRRFSFGLPPAVVIPLATLLIAYLLAFLSSLSEYYRFTASRSAKMLYLSGGLFTRCHFRVPVDKIESVDLRYGLASRWFAGVSAYVNASGLAAGTFAPALIPAGSLMQTVRHLRRLLPELGSMACPIKVHPKDACQRYLLGPLICLAASAAAGIVAAVLAPDMARLFAFWTVMLCAEVAWVAAHRLHAMFHSGVGVYETHLCLKYGKWFRYHRVMIPKDRIDRITVAQSAPQRAHGVCTLIVSETARRRRRHIVRIVPYEPLTAALKRAGYETWET